jgi:hypothetical protein
MPIHCLHLGPLDVRTWTLVGQLPFAALMVLLYRAGRARGWPWRSSLLATSALAAGLSLGAMVLPSVLGAMAGGTALWLVAQRALGLRRVPWATLAIGLITVVAVGRLGCLLNDCCFGRTTDLPWAIHYGAGSATWILHRTLGWLAPDAPVSLPVHPYPLYESVGLLLWLPVALVLRRRLRSEAALLLLSAAYDLALRGLIDGTRAMVNVWWGLCGSLAGLNVFQWSLLGASALAAGGALALEQRARRRTVVAVTTEETGVLVPWLLFAGLWLTGWLTDSAQTPFLHRVLLVALAMSALALRSPIPLALPRRAGAWLAPAAAIIAAVPLALHLERQAHATQDGTPNGQLPYGWIYEIDHSRGLMVRIGAEKESPATVQERRAALDLPAETAEPAAPIELPPERRSHTWVGGGAFMGSVNYRVGESCNDQYTIYDRTTGGGWLQAEREVPSTPSSVFWLGGRGMAVFESQTKTDHDKGTDMVTRYRLQTYAGQLWATWEHPNVSIGTGAILGLRSLSFESGPPDAMMRGSSVTPFVRPSFHLRAGFSFLGIDGGLYDRQSLGGVEVGHIGLSGAIGRGFTRIRHPDDTLVRYFVGVMAFPGADEDQGRPMLGGSLEVFATRRLMLGVQGAARDGGFGMGYVRTIIGP